MTSNNPGHVRIKTEVCFYSFQLNHYITTILSIYMSYTEISSSLSLELGHWTTTNRTKKKKKKKSQIKRQWGEATQEI